MTDKDKVEGAAKDMGGKVQETAGKMTGNESMEARGRGKQVEGKVQKTFGGAKDKMKDIGNKVRGK